MKNIIEMTDEELSNYEDELFVSNQFSKKPIRSSNNPAVRGAQLAGATNAARSYAAKAAEIEKEWKRRIKERPFVTAPQIDLDS